jgi:hypothetical protein
MGRAAATQRGAIHGVRGSAPASGAPLESKAPCSPNFKNPVKTPGTQPFSRRVLTPQVHIIISKVISKGEVCLQKSQGFLAFKTSPNIYDIETFKSPGKPVLKSLKHIEILIDRPGRWVYNDSIPTHTTIIF